MSRITKAPRWQILLAFAAVYLIWGSTYLGIRFAIATIPPFLMAGTRFLIAGIILYAWSRLRGAPPPTKKNWGAVAIIGALMLLGGNGGVTWAEQQVPSSLTALLVATEPAWLVLLVWILPRGERPTLAQVAGIVIGFAGVSLLIFQDGGTSLASWNTLGVAAILASALSWAAGSLYSVRADIPRQPLLANGMIMLAGGTFLTLTGIANGEAAHVHLDTISKSSLTAMVYLILFGSLIGFSAYTWLLSATTPARASTYAYVNPAVAVFLGWAIGKEEISVYSLIAMAVIISGVVLLTWKKQDKKKLADTDEPEPASVSYYGQEELTEEAHSER